MFAAERSKVIVFSIVFVLAAAILSTVAFSQKKDNSHLATYTIGPTITLSQCSACHQNIDSFSKKNLIFNHWAHFKVGVNCSTCHTRLVHREGGTTVPQMEVCFSCHGLSHSKQGLTASGECKTCHPANFNRLPSNHSAEFIATSHKAVKKDRLKLNNCMICHSKGQCKSCHDQKKVKTSYRNYYFDGRLQPEMKPELQLITFNEITTLSQCVACHKDLDANTAPGLVFNHWIHFKNGVKCDTCHQGLVHSKGEIKKPSMEFCYSCHGIKHSKQGLVATEECRACHTKGFNLKPSSHNALWLSNHKKKVSEEMFSCLTCHQKSFCQNCHTARNVRPPKVKLGFAKNVHERTHIQKDKDCTICHNDRFCTKCHSTPMPHPYTWLGSHRSFTKGNLKAKTGCRKCHDERPFCDSCHHAAKAARLYGIHFKSTEMNLKNCVKCHDEFTESRKNLVKKGVRAKESGVKIHFRSMVTHQVHFKKNFICEACHKPGLTGLKNGTFQGLCKIEGCHPEGQKKPPSEPKLCFECHPTPHER